jgi:hypothetical protein
MMPVACGPMGLACPRAKCEGLALVLVFGLRLWQSAWSFPSLSFVYKFTVFLVLYRQTIHLLFFFSVVFSRVNKSALASGGNDDILYYVVYLRPLPALKHPTLLASGPDFR